MTDVRHAADAPRELSLLGIVNVLLRHRRIVIGLPVVLAFLVVGVGLVLPRTWTAKATFMPQSNAGSLSRLAGLAAQLGVNVPTEDPGQSPEFYAELVGSDPILREAVTTEYRVVDGGDTVRADLITLYKMGQSTPELRREEAVKLLREQLVVSTGLKTSVVRLAARARTPELAQQIADRLLGLVNTFDLEKRRSQATQERTFIEARLEEARENLRTAEDRLQAFLQQNREFRSSAQLSFQHDRLEREVAMRQQLYTSLAEASEKARIEEVRNTPVITIIEAPLVPARPDSRRLALKGLLALLVGGLAAVGFAFGRELARATQAADPTEAQHLRRLGAEALGDLRRVWRFFGRRREAAASHDGR